MFAYIHLRLRLASFVVGPPPSACTHVAIRLVLVVSPLFRVTRWNVDKLVSALEAKLISSVEISVESFLNRSKNKLVGDIKMRQKGLELISEGKMAIVLLLNEIENQGCIGDPTIVENEAADLLEFDDGAKGELCESTS